MSIERHIPRATIPYVERPSLPGGGVHGAARWLTTQETIDAQLHEPGGVMFGYSSVGYMTYRGDGHSMFVAPQGSGKGVGFVVPNLVTYPGSMIVIDPKGENAAMTAQHRRDVLGQDVFVLDPCGVTGLPSHSYNPLSWLEGTTASNFMEELKSFARAVIENGYGKETFWSDCARSLFVGLVCYLAGHDRKNLTLNALYRLTRLPYDEWLRLMELMSRSTCPHPQMQQWVRDAGAWYLGQEAAHQRYHLGTVQEAVSWMGNLGAASVMGRSDFDFRALKRKPMTVYLCVHPMQLSAYRGWFRLLVSQAIMGVFDNMEKPCDANGDLNSPVLFMLDEFARAVGNLKVVDDALPQMRGYGGRFAFVLQNVGQLKELFPHGWESFEENCGLRVYLQSRGETSEFVSRRLGPTTRNVFASGGFSQTGRPLFFPQEITQLPSTSQIAFIENLAPMLCHRITSYEDGNFSQFLRHFDGARTGDHEVPLLQQLDEAHNLGYAGATRALEERVVPEVSQAQRDALVRFTGGGWD